MLGKPVDSDLKEGKLTYLFLKAFEKGTKEQVEFLRYAHGNKNITEADAKSQRHHHRNRRFVPLSEVESDVGTEGEKYISQITKTVITKIFSPLLLII